MKFKSDVDRWKILSQSDPTQAASVMGVEDPSKAAKMADELGASYMEEVVAQLDSDTAADLLRNLPLDFRESIIAQIEPEKAANIREILSFEPGKVGGIMSKEYLAVPVDKTIREVTEYLQNLPLSKKGKVSYIYVVDAERRLVGVMQIRDLIFHAPDTKIANILVSPVVQVEVGMSQSDAAKLLQRHRYLGLPVVDASQRLAGVISADNVLTAMEEKAAHDIAKIVGTDAEEIRTHSVLRIIQMRFPWLLVNIISGTICAFISEIFQRGPESVIVLFLFIPLVLGLSESTGVQGATIVVRNITLGNVSIKDLGSLFVREMGVGVLIGLICGTLVGVVASFWQASPKLGLALGASMTLAIFISSLIGLLLPLLFRRLKIDPAIASGPLVLSICDLQTLIVYFGLSSRILAG